MDVNILGETLERADVRPLKALSQLGLSSGNSPAENANCWLLTRINWKCCNTAGDYDNTLLFLLYPCSVSFYFCIFKVLSPEFWVPSRKMDKGWQKWKWLWDDEIKELNSIRLKDLMRISCYRFLGDLFRSHLTEKRPRGRPRRDKTSQSLRQL